MKYILLSVLASIFSFSNIVAQTYDQDGDHDHHAHHKNELGIANSPVYFVNEEEFAYGLHIHLVRNIGDSKFGLGFGYERIFDDHKHSTYGIVATYRPIERLSINASPGLTFEADESNALFAFHFESSYEYVLSDFHIGPVFELAYDPEDIHVSLGLHVGYGF